VDAKIDYVSFTVLVDVREGSTFEGQLALVAEALTASHPAFTTRCMLQLDWLPGAARGHYSSSIRQPDTFAMIRFGGTANHILVELPGTACAWLTERGVLLDVVTEAAGRLTRLDVAVDIPGGALPAEFVGAGYNERFVSHASIVSAEGTTEYVGSMKSERFARVYQYAAPHPRAGITRVEHVYRSEYARAAAAVLIERGVVGVAAASGATWGWRSTSWQLDALDSGRIQVTRADRHQPGRVRWLHQVVIPALVRADADGLLTLEELIESLTTLRLPRATA